MPDSGWTDRPCQTLEDCPGTEVCLPRPGVDGGTCFLPAPFPQVPEWPDGGVLVHPEVTTIDWAGYALDSEFQSYVQWLVGSPWLASFGADYCVGSATYERHLVLPGKVPAPTTADGTADVGNILSGLFDGGLLPPPTANSIYLFAFPPPWPGNVHGSVLVGHQYVPFAELADRNDFSDFELQLSHEFAEAITDPQIGYTLAFTPWSYASGSEVGDLCESNPFVYDAGWVAQRVWSNALAALGRGSPCAPVPADEVFVSLSPETPGLHFVTAGAPVSLRFTGWSSQPALAGRWPVTAQWVDGVDTHPQQDVATVASGEVLTVTIEFPADSPSGAQSWLRVYTRELDGVTYNDFPVGFQVQ